MDSFEQALTGGHPNSLGNTEAVVAAVLADPSRLEELYGCYFSTDPVVRLRVSNAMKRIEKADHALLLPYLDRFLDEVATLEQASTKWTLAQLFLAYQSDLSPGQQRRATALLQRNLQTSDDWMVINMTLNTLAAWAAKDDALREWLVPHLQDFEHDERKSVRGRAAKFLKKLTH